MNKFLCLASLLLLVACTSEKPGDTGVLKPSDTGNARETTAHAPSDSGGMSYALEIFPSDAARNSTLNLRVMGFNLPDATIEWLLNGSPVPNPTPHRFIAASAIKGDTVQVKAFIKGTEVLSNKVKMKNTPPEIQTVKFLPEVVRPGDRLGIEVFPADIDGDAVAIAYEWTRNGEPAGTGKQIEGTLKRGDQISIKITPFDGESYGSPAILKREIMNVSPVIAEHNNYGFDGRVFTFQTKATDPDNDTLTYALKEAPAGMTIHSGTGLIQWEVRSDFKGKASFIVSVSDGHGGETRQNLFFSLTSDSGK